MVVAIIGSNDYNRSSSMAIRMWSIIGRLVVKDGDNIFLFSNANSFDKDCWEIVSQLKMHFNVERHYIHGGCDYDVGYVDNLSEFYDELYFPEKGIVFPCYLRDRAMIDKCDVLVTYCDNEQLQTERKNSVALAVAYAMQKKKRVINLFEG